MIAERWATALATAAVPSISPQSSVADFGRWVVRVRAIDDALTITTAPGSAPPLFAQAHGLAIVVGGEVDNAAELARACGMPHDASVTEIVMHLYRQDGIHFVRRLAGEFCIVVSDTAAGVRVVRDPLGMHPLYYARKDGRVLLSPNLADLMRVGDISRDVDPAVLAEYVLRTYGSASDTVFRHVRRVPPGTIASFSANGVRLERYWDPAPEDRPIAWLGEDELSRFGDVFARSIARSMSRQRTGVFLSGGLDSVAVAARATRIAQQQSRTAPVALSLEFPEPSNEAAVQSAVAQQLGLRHELVRLEHAAGGDGLLASAVAMGSSWPTPMMTFWNPAYAHLASLAGRHGCDTILTGRGGDEWLVLSPTYAADLLQRGNIAGLFRLVGNHQRSVPLNVRRSQLEYVLTHAIRPIAAHAFARVAAGQWRAYHARRAGQQIPSWIAPDSSIRRDVDGRAAARRVPARLTHGHYVHASKDVLTDPVITYDLEESYEFGRRSGIRVRHPFWQAELVDFLFRYPPDALNQPRGSKWLVRDELAKDFPALGFDRQKKLMAFDVFTSIVRREAPPLWRRLGGARRLGQLGIVDAAAVDRVMPRLLASPSPVDVARVWEIMNLESWTRVQL